MACVQGENRRQTFLLPPSEHPFGTVKWHHGAHDALLKGRSRVAGEYALSFLAYNMRRALKLTGMEKLLDLFRDR
ncbi:MAG: hypothetical protein QM296_07040, partial [Bacillota bacterium]|nr:hypothetical protein [Bacillota bacterium]